MSTQAIDYQERYKQAHAAYCKGKYDQANQIINEMAQKYPKDVNIMLLQGHINVGLENCGVAKEFYQAVLSISDRSELKDYALQGLAQVKQIESTKKIKLQSSEEFITSKTESAWEIPQLSDEDNSEFGNNWSGDLSTSSWGTPSDIDWDSNIFSDEDSGEPTLGSTGKQNIDPFSEEEEEDSIFTLKATTSTATQLKNNKENQEQNSHLDDFGSILTNQTSKLQEDQPFDMGETTESAHYIPNLADTSTFIVSDDLTEESINSFGSENDYLSSTETLEFEIGETGEDSFLKHLDSLDQNELENISKFDITDISKGIPGSGLFDVSDSVAISESLTQGSTSSISQDLTGYPDTTTLERPPEKSSNWIQPNVGFNQGKLAWFKNAPLKQKQLITAAVAGVTPMLVALLFTLVSSVTAPKPKPSTNLTSNKVEHNNSLSLANPQVLWLILTSGLAGFGATFFMGKVATDQTKKAIDDLQTQLQSISEGEFNVKATIYSKDELGQLTARFNQVSRVILTATREAQRRAEETESSRNELHRQVIRLLDDVEGAARGDLTVEAEVTADVLGAVADAFNLTIQNLREIVRQVKKAAEQVNKASKDSESYARNQSNDAHRMAEELAVTLNSVQLMTESIQRVAESARQAEEVARTSSVTALRGGEAVERTVAGILQIRETVSETARKVKRLAEASQEISKIVNVISQIASRTNLLALNASIQAAKAGEAGRGFAIVADEVRQLADRSAKSLKEIQQIVLQIQSETGLVMTAMEEGIQQVIDVTDKSEMAKNALDDIIQVSNRIDFLVRSITGDTVRQRENSRAVSNVVQAVELTSQETAQESQRVAGALLNLVSISKDLLVSVERFRIDTNEHQV